MSWLWETKEFSGWVLGFSPSDVIQLLFWEDESLPAAVISASTNKTSKKKKGLEQLLEGEKSRAILCILSIFSFSKRVVQKKHLECF